MWLDELKDLVEELRQRIRDHREVLDKSESTTRYALIDPLLTKVGWRLADPSHVLTEYRPKHLFTEDSVAQGNASSWTMPCGTAREFA